MAAEVPDPLILLQRSERVRALARRLLRGDDGAEDVAQEALLASLAWRDLDDEPLPARLAARVRSLASRWRRGRARRARREAEVARPDRSASVDELVERAAWQRTLVEAVLELEEPYRECVLLRYFENLAPRDIAARLDLPVRTVHTRLARALVQLRARLERRVDLSAWVPLLAPLALPPARPLALPASSLGALAVAPSKWTVSLVAGAVVASTLLVLRAAGVFDAPHPLARPVASVPVRPESIVRTDSGGELRGVSPAVDERSAAEAAHDAPEPDIVPPPDRELDLFGEVVDVFGQPLGDVELSALAIDRSYTLTACLPPLGGTTIASTHSDAQGHFRLRLERGQQCTLEASLPGLATTRLVDRQAGERVRVVLGPSCSLFGRVLREDGTPLADAVVTLGVRTEPVTFHSVCYETTSAADGSYAFEGLPASAYHPVVRCASARDLLGDVLRLVPGAALEQDFVLRSGESIKGRVLDARTGAPIAGAEVDAAAFFENAVRTATDGSFTVHGWDPDAQGEGVYARAPGYATARHELPQGARLTGPIELALEPGSTWRGRVLDPRGAPQVDAHVQVYVSDQRPGFGHEKPHARTGDDGRFELTGVARDRGHTLIVTAPGAGRLLVDLPDFDPDRDPRDLGDLDLPVESTLAGRVVDSEGEPLAGAFVSLIGGAPGVDRLRRSDPRPLLPVLPPVLVRVDDLGRFWIDGLSRGEYEVSSEMAGTSRSARTVISLGEGERREGLELVVDLGLTIAGSLVGPSGEPITEAIVQVIPRRGSPSAGGIMNSRTDGSFELTGLDAGEYVLVVAHFASPDRRAYSPIRIDGVSAGDVGLRIELPVAETIRGVVVGRDGSPLYGATVQVDYGDGTIGGYDAVPTDPQGRFHLSVPAGPPVDLLAQDWRRAAEGVDALRQDTGHLRGVQPGATDVVIRIEP